MTQFKITGLSNIVIDGKEISIANGIAEIDDDLIASDSFARFYAETRYMSDVEFEEVEEVEDVKPTKKGKK